MNKFRLLFLFTVIGFGFFNKSNATHIRGGNISVSVISTRPLVVLFKVSLYRDSNSITNIGGGLLNFWDGTSARLGQNADSIDIKYLGNQIEEYIFYISHTYSSETGFIAPFYFEANRNAGTVNLQNSVSIPFFIESQIIIAPNGQINNSPIFQIPPNDEGVVGELFIHNVGAYDPDGDSLSYELITPYQQKEIEVVSYEIPDSSWIDKYGNILWDKPVFVGQYTYALRVTEWRFFDGRWQDIGFVIRDMQVYIRDLPNAPPTITPNGSICVVAGETAIIDMVVEDSNGNMISVELFNDLNLSPSEYITSPSWDNPLPSGTEVGFQWITNCTYVRRNPYQFYFKVTDNFPSTQLSGFAVWNVQVIGPAPNWKNISIVEQTASLKWDNKCEGAETIEIWRSVGSTDFQDQDCLGGISEKSGYTLIDQVSILNTAYIDSNNGMGLSRGAAYCYRLVMVWPDGSKSLASEEKCITIPVESPVITRVSVIETDSLNGSIDLQWTSSFDLPDSIDQSNFSYRVNYQTEVGNQQLELVFDTLITVSNLDTRYSQYTFQIDLVSENVTVDSSSLASNVFLATSSEQSEIALSWEANVPWNNASTAFPWHYIFRNRLDQDHPEQFLLLDSVNVVETGPSYLDSGSESFLHGYYSYYISTFGTYGNPSLPSPLINQSQVAEQLAIDLNPPCPPSLIITNGTIEDCKEMIEELGCRNAEFHNDLDLRQGCDDKDFSKFKIYYRSKLDGEFSALSETSGNQFIHNGLESLAGCYYITSVDYSGNESQPSEIICRDNCLNILVPNVFTPNGDDVNDYFAIIETKDGIQISCFQFIQQIDITVVNRLGLEIYNKSISDPESFLKLWDGFDHQKKVASGIYYYNIFVSYKSLDFRTEEISGWVQVLY